MHINRRADICASVPDRWAQQYSGDRFGSEKHLITAALRSLERANGLTKEAIDAAIGNESWTRNECNECGVDADLTITVGEPMDYESHTATLCADCIARAADKLRNETNSS